MAAVMDHIRAFSSTKDILVKTQPVEADCDHESTSNARHLLSFYQSHADIIVKLLNHHDSVERRLDESEKTRKALAIKLERTEKELNTAKADLSSTRKEAEKTKGELTNNRKELQSTKGSLKNVEQNLLSTQKELTATHATLGNTQKKLQDAETEVSKVKQDLKTSESKFQQATTDLKATKEELETTKNNLGNTQNDLKEAQAEASSDYERLKERLTKADEGQEIAQAEVIAEKNRNRILEKEKDKAQNDLEKMRKEGKNGIAFLHWPDRRRGDVYIDEVIYGGVNIKSQSVINKLLEYAANKTQFTVTNDLMGGDPWEGTIKTFTMVYSFGSKGPFRYYSCKEGNTARFE